MSAKLKSRTQNGGQTGKGIGGQGGKGNGDKSKEKSKGLGKDQEQGKGGVGGGPDKESQEKNQDGSWVNPNPMPRGTNPEPSGGQQNPGLTTCSQTQAQQEQGATRGNKDEDVSHPRKRLYLMLNASKLRKKGFDVTCPAGF